MVARNGKWEADLSDLSALNALRHRQVRYFITIALAAIAGVILLVSWLVVVIPPVGYVSHQFAILAAVPETAFLVLLVGSLDSYAFRFLGTPPTSLSVESGGLKFQFSSGLVQELSWDNPDLEVEVLDRSGEAKTPEVARFRIWVRGSSWDRRLPWRRVIPLTYVTREALEAVINSARTAGARVTVERFYNAISLGTLTSTESTAYLIEPGPTFGKGW